jgi:hypothetical protein
MGDWLGIRPLLVMRMGLGLPPDNPPEYAPRCLIHDSLRRMLSQKPPFLRHLSDTVQK